MKFCSQIQRGMKYIFIWWEKNSGLRCGLGIVSDFFLSIFFYSFHCSVCGTKMYRRLNQSKTFLTIELSSFFYRLFMYILKDFDIKWKHFRRREMCKILRIIDLKWKEEAMESWEDKNRKWYPISIFVVDKGKLTKIKIVRIYQTSFQSWMNYVIRFFRWCIPFHAGWLLTYFKG